MIIMSLSVLLQCCHAQLKTYTENISYDSLCRRIKVFKSDPQICNHMCAKQTAEVLPTDSRAEAVSTGSPMPLELTARPQERKAGLKQEACRTFNSFNSQTVWPTSLSGKTSYL